MSVHTTTQAVLEALASAGWVVEGRKGVMRARSLEAHATQLEVDAGRWSGQSGEAYAEGATAGQVLGALAARLRDFADSLDDAARNADEANS